MFQVPLILLFIMSVHVVHAKMEIPKNMKAEDRVEFLQILGPTTSYKLLSDPFPLGGFEGVEIGLSGEVISVSEVSQLGTKSTTQNDLTINKLTLGKGLYNDIDLFFSFSPFRTGEDLSAAGGMLRWTFFEGAKSPVYFGTGVSVNHVGLQNKVSISNLEYLITGGYNFQDLSLYGGYGLVRTTGIFEGGSGGVTDSDDTTSETFSSWHSLIGVHLKFSDFFMALQMDRYAQNVYSAQIGFRY